MSDRCLIIDLHERSIECWACGLPYRVGYGLPIGDSGELVSNDYEGEWSGVPACYACWQAHEEGLLTEANLQEWRHRRQLQDRALASLIVRE